MATTPNPEPFVDPTVSETPAPEQPTPSPDAREGATLEPVNNPQENKVEAGSSRTGLHPMDLYDQGVGGDYLSAPGGGAGPGSGPVDAFGNAIYKDQGLNPLSDDAKVTNQKLQQHPVDFKAAGTEDPVYYQPEVRDTLVAQQKQAQASQSPAPLSSSMTGSTEPTV